MYYCKFKTQKKVKENYDTLYLIKQEIITNTHEKSKIKTFSYNYGTKTLISGARNGAACIYNIKQVKMMIK